MTTEEQVEQWLADEKFCGLFIVKFSLSKDNTRKNVLFESSVFLDNNRSIRTKRLAISQIKSWVDAQLREPLSLEVIPVYRK